jgi:hypothetical protein
VTAFSPTATLLPIALPPTFLATTASKTGVTIRGVASLVKHDCDPEIMETGI